MPKILILANKVPYPAKDGSSIAMARLLENLIEMGGNEITYGALNTVKHRKHLDDFPKEIKSQIALTTFNEDTTPTVISGLTNLLLTNKPFHTVRFYVHSMTNWLQGFDDRHFDYVILEGAFMGDYLPLAKVKGKRVILRAHNLEHMIWERSMTGSASALKSFYFKIQAGRLKRFEYRLSQLTDAVWSISPVDSFWFKSINSNTHFVPVSIHASPIDFKVAPKKCFFLGALDWLPNLESIEWFLSEVWPRVHEQDPSIEFHIAGNNTPDHLRKVKMNNVFIHGRVPSAEAFSKSHGISIIPLLSGSGVRIKLLENGSYGIPTISTRIGAEGVYDQNFSKIPLTDFPVEFANRLVELTNNPEKATAIGLEMHEDITSRFSSATSIASIKVAWPKL